MKARNEVSEQYKWKLEDLFQSDEEWEASFQETKKEIGAFAQFQGTLGQSIDRFKEMFDAQANVGLLVERLYVYALMRRDEDNANAVYQGFADRAMGLIVAFETAVSFVDPEIMEIDPMVLDSWRQENVLAEYAHILDDMVRNRPHVLSQAEEKLLALSGEIGGAPRNIFKMLDYADLRFPVIQTKQGEEQLTHGNYIRFMEDEDRETRKNAFEALYASYTALENTFATTLASSNKNDIFVSTARHFPSALEASLFEDNVPVSVYDNLIHAIDDNLSLMHEYVALRKKVLKLDQVHFYDIYAPLSRVDYDHISYEEAQRLVLEATKPLGEEYTSVLKRAFDERWIDVYENKGKTSGAYSWGCYGTHPYVLMNYQNNIDSVFTLAHEMGHAMHTWFSDENQTYVNAQYKILIAEVASTVNESLLMDYLLKNETDHDKRLRLLNYQLEQFRGTVYRQVMFAEFEKQTHEATQNGQPLTSEDLKSMYLDLNRRYYGDEMVIDEPVAMEWARISHFYTAFYVYKYATGFSSAVALSRMILESEEGAKRYLQFLSSGGSDYPLEILKRAGVDLTSEKPVRDALLVFKELLAELKELV